LPSSPSIGRSTLQALRLYVLPEAAPAVLNGTPLLSGSGRPLDAKRVGAPATSWNSARGTANHATIGAAAARRHIEQWQTVGWCKPSQCCW
jgi:hypothetical protein